LQEKGGDVVSCDVEIFDKADKHHNGIYTCVSVNAEIKYIVNTYSKMIWKT